jgi:hypothetical protein
VNDEPVYAVESYWKSLVFELPNIFVIAFVLLACTASEAGCERFFSSEAFVHSELRNKLGNEVTNAITFVRGNYGWLTSRTLRTFPEEDDGEVVLI